MISLSNVKILVFSTVLMLFILITPNAFAESPYDKTTVYDQRFFGIVSGDYNTKNGNMKLSGIYKYGNDSLSDVKIIGVLKYWDYYDSSIPQCFHAFSDDMTIWFDKNKSYGKMLLVGKLCVNNWNSNWQTFRGDYVIIDGKTPSSDGMNGKGLAEFLINMKSGHIISGKINGNLILYT